LLIFTLLSRGRKLPLDIVGFFPFSSISFQNRRGLERYSPVFSFDSHDHCGEQLTPLARGVFVNTEITGSDKHAKTKPNISRGRGFGGDRCFPPRTNAVCVTVNVSGGKPLWEFCY
jgi:hypothetical protein